MGPPGCNPRRKSTIKNKSKQRAAAKADRNKKKRDLKTDSILGMTETQKNRLRTNPKANVSLSKKKMRLMMKQIKKDQEMAEAAAEARVDQKEEGTMEVDAPTHGTTLGGPQI